MSQDRDASGITRRRLFRWSAAGVAAVAAAPAGCVARAAETPPAMPAAFMMFPGNYTWSAAVRGALGTAPWGGSELGEVYAACAALQGRVGDGKAWFAEWSALGRKVTALGEAADTACATATASAAYMRAANYLQVGERLLQPRTEESQQTYARAVELFERGARTLPFLSIANVEVPFEGGKSLPAYFVKSRDAGDRRWPTVVFVDGLDITKEMQYFRGVPELVKRGIACLIVDGPGTGEAIRFRGMPARYDSNVAGSAAVDYLATRADVDASRLAVMGISLGGYYAPRAAAFEKRYKACVSWAPSGTTTRRGSAAWRRRSRRHCPCPASTSRGSSA